MGGVLSTVDSILANLSVIIGGFMYGRNKIDDLTGERIGHLLSNESNLADYIANNPTEACVKTLMSQASEKKNRHAMKIILEFIAHHLRERLKNNSVCIWPGEEMTENDDRNTVLVCHHSGPCDKTMEYFYGLKIIYREYDAVDDGSRIARSFEISSNRDQTYQMYDLVNQAIQIHGCRLFEEHSNLEAISSGSKISPKSKYRVPEVCVIIYCRLKGIIPFGEAPFPKQLKVNDKQSVAIDVRAGYFSFNTIQHNEDYSFFMNKGTSLKMGSSVGPFGHNITGTIGPFVEINGNKPGFLTCAHVMFGNDADQLRNLHARGTRIDVVQPSNSTNICGKVLYAVFNANWTDSTSEQTCGPTPMETCESFDLEPNNVFGIDAALIEITSRAPRTGEFVLINNTQLSNTGFTMHQPPVFDTGASMAFPIRQQFQRPVIKVGSETGLTRGLLALVGGMVRYSSIDGNLYSINKTLGKKEIWHGLIEICPTIDGPFCASGDSGAGVFLVGDDNKLTCIGLIIGALSDGTGIATPIDKVLTALSHDIGQQILLKSFIWKSFWEN